MKYILFILSIIFGFNFVFAVNQEFILNNNEINTKKQFALNLRGIKQKANDYVKNLTSQLFDFSGLSGDIKNMNNTKINYDKQINQNRKDFYKKYPDIKIYLKKDLTQDDKKNLKTLVAAQVLKIKNLYKDAETQKTDGTYNNDIFLEELETIENEYFTQLEQYIDSDKLSDFLNYTIEFIRIVKNNHTLRQEMLIKINEIKNNMVNTISSSFKEKIGKIGEFILDKERRKNLFNKILTTIKTKKDNIIKNVKESSFIKNIKVEILSNFEKIMNEYISNIK